MVLRGTCTSVRPRSFATHVETGRPQIEAVVYALCADEPNDPTGGPAGSSAHGLHDPALVALPVAVFFVVALVVLLLALGKSDLELGAAFLPVQFQRHDGVAA